MDIATSGVAEGLVARLRAARGPLVEAMRGLAAEVGDARQEVSRCDTSLGMIESLEAEGLQQLQSDRNIEETIAATRAKISRLCTEAQFEEAFSCALKCDLSSNGAVACDSMVQWSCEEALAAVSPEGGDRVTPEAFLAHEPPTLRSAKVQLSLMSRLLQLAVAPAVPLDRIELNLEWVLCLEDVFEPAPSLRGAFEAAASSMSEALEELLLAKSPESLATASSSARQRIVRSARMVSKQLEILRRTTSLVTKGTD